MGGRGSGGSNAKPSAIKKLEGNRGRRKINESEPQPKPGVPVMPEKLSPEAQQEWKRIIPLLEDMKVLTQVDGMALAAYCSAVAQWFKAEAIIEQLGIVVAENRPMGKVLKVNPACRVKSDALQQLNRFLMQFGLSPASRTRIKTEGPGPGAGAGDPADPFNALANSDDIVQ